MCLMYVLCVDTAHVGDPPEVSESPERDGQQHPLLRSPSVATSTMSPPRSTRSYSPPADFSPPQGDADTEDPDDPEEFPELEELFGEYEADPQVAATQVVDSPVEATQVVDEPQAATQVEPSPEKEV